MLGCLLVSGVSNDKLGYEVRDMGEKIGRGKQGEQIVNYAKDCRYLALRGTPVTWLALKINRLGRGD